MRVRVSAVCTMMATTLGTALVPLVNPIGAQAATGSDCGQWTATQVAGGYGMLESLAFDGRGGMLLSEQALTGTGGGIRRLSADGVRSTVVPEVSGAGPISVIGDVAYYTTGLSVQSKLAKSEGTIASINLGTGVIDTIAVGLAQPNGLAKLPSGEFVVANDMSDDTRLTLVRGGAAAGPYSSAATSTNGVAYDAARQRIYVSSTFDPTTAISVIDPARPEESTRIELPGFGPLNAADGLSIGPDGMVYVALNVGGRIVRVDPDSGHWCTIAENLPLSTHVQFGDGPGWDRNSLYVSSYLGTVTRLSPR
ncbi:SMP-30/gluconolactonase/LRE family protein [Nocardia jejuensis]|uniref:SMP-30/gluconolactonase/LRE family protein n=1 Tax=Nocardia jejuensis TaxID=328049 RepID=UPI00082FFFBA|nr:SMP-30/gluconolactonase/LRE family protein [Nocardia jejuensis]